MKKTIVMSFALALTPVIASAQDAGIGQSLYNQYCSTCHGVTGDGKGPLTEFITEMPTDLRKMAAENPAEPGVFPMLKVLHIIDGRTGLRAHGGSMPTFGAVFMADALDEKEEMGAVLETRGRILSLAMYLESIQE